MLRLKDKFILKRIILQIFHYLLILAITPGITDKTFKPSPTLKCIELF